MKYKSNKSNQFNKLASVKTSNIKVASYKTSKIRHVSSMGQFLSEAKKDKDTISGEADPDSNLRLTFSASSMQGWRRTMEDTVKVELKLP